MNRRRGDTMNFSNQLKKYRKRHHFSQEKLAEKIYVSRQTISNWENGKTYPDIQHLITLSLLFDVSVDELLKGDVETMKQTVEGRKQFAGNTQTLFMSFAALIILVGVMLLSEQFGTATLSAMLVAGGIMLASAIRIEYLKRKYNIKKYRDIIDYMEDGKVSEKSPVPISISLSMWIISFIIIAIIVYLIVR